MDIFISEMSVWSYHYN